MSLNDPTVENPQEVAFEELREIVDRKFNKYRLSGNEHDLPSLKLLFEDYCNRLDLDTFLKPVVQQCHSFIYDDSLDYGPRKTIVDRIRAYIEDIKTENHDLSFLLAWLQFHSVRLGKFTLTASNVQKLNEWLRHCYNLEDRNTIYYFTVFEMNRDQEMRSIVFDQGEVRNFFTSEATPGKNYVPKLVDWFFHRYDLIAATALLNSRRNQKIEDKNIQTGFGKRSSLKFWLFCFLPVVFMILLIFSIFSANGYAPVFFISYIRYIDFFPLVRYQEIQNSIEILIWHAVLYQIFGLILVTIVIINILKNWKDYFFDDFKRVLPRLLAGILVGYVPLLYTEEIWKWFFQIPAYPAIVIWFIMLLVSFVCLYVEARKTLTEGKISRIMHRELWFRVIHVFSIGLFQALIMGFVINEVFGATVVANFLTDMGEGSVIAIAGWFGYIFPKLILLYTPFALFLGIIIQLIWEESTAAQPF